MPNLFKRALNALLMQKDGRTWQRLEYFDPLWSNRIKAMAAYIPAGASVLDLGCGKMWLKEYIPTSAYYPVDYTNRGEGTIVCDFNKKEFPAEKADVAFVSGTLEYVADPKWFLSQIASHASQCVISYCITEDYPDQAVRAKQAWVNSFSRAELVTLFSGAGFHLAAEDSSVPKNRIFHFLR